MKAKPEQIVAPSEAPVQGGLAVREIPKGPNVGQFELSLHGDHVGIFLTFESAADYRARILTSWANR